MRRAVMIALCCLGGCGQSDTADQAMKQEKIEIEACRTTFPIGRGQFGALVRCEMSAAASYVQQTDPSERKRQSNLANDLAARADAVDQGRLTIQDWQSRANDAIHALKDARRTAEATSAVL